MCQLSRVRQNGHHILARQAGIARENFIDTKPRSHFVQDHRVPRTQGFPCPTSGSTLIRCRQSLLIANRIALPPAYIRYGSEAAGRARPDSDVDLAALTQRAPLDMEAMDLRAKLEARLGRDVDLLFLGQASPIVAWQVLRHGKLVYEGNARRRAQLEIRTVTAYADLKRSRAPVERALIDRMSLAP